MLRHAIGAAAVLLTVASVDPAARAADQGRSSDLRRLGRHGLHHRVAEGRCLASTRPAQGGPQQVYDGSISKFGLDIGITGGGVMVWGVFTADTVAGPGFLAGDYFGASGEVTIAAGLGANVLIGGSNRTVALQPVSVESRSDSISPSGVADSSCAPAADDGSVPDRHLRAARCGRPFAHAARACPPGSALAPETPAPLANSPSGLKRWLERSRRRPHLGSIWEADMAQNGTRATGPRCIALVGPFQSGKTTLLEAILARTGAIQRQGTVDAGNTVGDASKEARHHQMSVEISVATTDFMGDTYTFVDCPGSVEFVHDMRAALPAVDAAVVVCELDEKKVPQLQLILRELEEQKIPRFLFLNKIDKADSTIHDVLRVLQPASRSKLLLRQIPTLFRR